jgi:hypothetical protein
VSDHWLDAMEYAMRPKESRHLRGWSKAWSWLRSRPLARVRRNLATRRRVRARSRLETALARERAAALAYLTYYDWGVVTDDVATEKLREGSPLLTFEEWLETSPRKKFAEFSKRERFRADLPTAGLSAEMKRFYGSSFQGKIGKRDEG